MGFRDLFGKVCCTASGGGGTPITCNNCNIPSTLTCTWRYRSISAACNTCGPSGSAVNTITFPMTGGALGPWVSGTLHLADHAQCAFNICSTYNVVVTLTCQTGGLRINIESHAASGTDFFGASENGVTVSPDSCSPFHYGVGFFTGPLVETPGFDFDMFDITG